MFSAVLLATSVLCAPTPRLGVVAIGKVNRERATLLTKNIKNSTQPIPILILPKASTAKPNVITVADAQLAKAQLAYQNFSTEQARMALKDLHDVLGLELHRELARLRLAAVYRLEALLDLMDKDIASARSNFHMAVLLSPEFAPSVDAWPPEARLAYADVVADVRNSSGGGLSIKLKPKNAALWVDGKAYGRGAQTVHALSPGLHRLTIRAPGFAPLSARVEVLPDSQLSQVDLFLTALSEEALALSLVTPNASPNPVAALLAQRLNVHRIVVLNEAQGTLYDHAGKQWATFSTSALPAALDAKLMLLNQTEASGAIVYAIEDPATPTPFYARKSTWVIGGVAVGTILAAVLLFFPKKDISTTTIVLGRP